MLKVTRFKQARVDGQLYLFGEGDSGRNLLAGWGSWGRVGRDNALSAAVRLAAGEPLVRYHRGDRAWSFLCPVEKCQEWSTGHASARECRAAWVAHCEHQRYYFHAESFVPGWPADVDLGPAPCEPMRSLADFEKAAMPGSRWYVSQDDARRGWAFTVEHRTSFDWSLFGYPGTHFTWRFDGDRAFVSKTHTGQHIVTLTMLAAAPECWQSGHFNPGDIVVVKGTGQKLRVTRAVSSHLICSPGVKVPYPAKGVKVPYSRVRERVRYGTRLTEPGRIHVQRVCHYAADSRIKGWCDLFNGHDGDCEDRRQYAGPPQHARGSDARALCDA